MTRAAPCPPSPRTSVTSRAKGALPLVALLLSACGEESPPPKPEISQECTLNGMGQGECSFTNTGSVKGAVCGHVMLVKCPDPSAKFCTVEKKDAEGNVVRDDGRIIREPGTTEKLNSSVFCSGQLDPATTAKVEFAVQSPSDFCTTTISRIMAFGGSELSWNDVCSFEFVAKKTTPETKK